MVSFKCMTKTALLAKNWSSDFREFLASAKKEILICSPYINGGGIDFLFESADNRCEVTLLTNLSSGNIVGGVTDPTPMVKMFDRFGSVRISSAENLHAKVYIADDTGAIVSSANMTNGGIYTNLEYGVLLSDASVVRAIRDDLERYFSIGNVLGESFLRTISDMKEGIEKIANKERGYGAEYEPIHTLLLENRVSGRRTVNGIFAETIVYLLEKYGSLSTDDLNGHIEKIHPDICDNTIDRIISGQSFGRKWKHGVRNAQQTLKEQHTIVLDSDTGLWKLIK